MASIGGFEIDSGVLAYPSNGSEATLFLCGGRTLVGFEVLVDGRPLRTVCHRGKTYLPVPRLGVEYEIRINDQWCQFIFPSLAYAEKMN